MAQVVINGTDRFANQPGVMPVAVEPLHAFERAALAAMGQPQTPMTMRQVASEAQRFVSPQAKKYMGSAADAFAASRGDFDPTTYQQYYNPFEQAVVSAADADLAESTRRAQDSVRAGFRDDRAFGSTALGTGMGQVASDMGRTRASTLANLRYSGFNDAISRAMSSFENARGRDAQAGNGYTNLGSTAQNVFNSAVSNLAGGQAIAQGQQQSVYDRLRQQLEAGSYIRGFNQNAANVVQSEIDRMQGYPSQQLDELQGRLGAFQPSQTQYTSQPNGITKLGGYLGVGSSIFDALNKGGK